MNLYEDSHVKAVSDSLPFLYQNYPAAQAVLLSPSDEGKLPYTKEWRKYFPSIDEVKAHLAENKRIGIVPKSVDMAVVDVDRGGAEGWKLIADTLSISDDEAKKYCLKSSRADKYHAWLPLKNELRIVNRKQFDFKSGCSGDLIYNGYVVLHQPNWHVMTSIVAGVRMRFFDQEVAVFFDRAIKSKSTGDTAVKVPSLKAAASNGLSKWQEGTRHNSMIACLKLITNPSHFKGREEITDCLNDVEIRYILKNNLKGEDICNHALSCGHNERDVSQALRDHMIALKEHKGASPNKTKSIKSESELSEQSDLLDMKRTERIKYMLKKSKIDLRWDVTRQVWEVDFNDGKGLRPYSTHPNNRQYQKMKGILFDNFPSLNGNSKNHGFDMQDSVWKTVHFALEDEDDIRCSAGIEYLQADKEHLKYIRPSDDPEIINSEYSKRCKHAARVYLKESLGIDSPEDEEYLFELSEFFFKHYALCLLNQNHMAKLVLILYGDRDVRKSSYVKTLIPREWHAGNEEGRVVDIMDYKNQERGHINRKFFTSLGTKKGDSWRREAGVQTEGCVGVLLDEINLSSGADANHAFKSLIGSSTIEYRPFYGDSTVTRIINWWWFGTANPDTLNLSVRDDAWVEKFAFIKVNKKIVGAQAYADKHLRDAIIGGLLLFNEQPDLYLNHPFSRKNKNTAAHKKWKEISFEIVGTPVERNVCNNIIEMMEAACQGPDKKGENVFRLKKFDSNKELDGKSMRFDDLILALQSYAKFTHKGDFTDKEIVYALKPRKDDILVASALRKAGWDSKKGNKNTTWFIVDKAYWAKKGFPGLSSETQPSP